MSQRSLEMLAAILVTIVAATPVVAQDPIDGVWFGEYTSTYSPNPTPEILLFKAVKGAAAGAYLSKSQAAGTLVGGQFGNTYTFLVTQPVEECVVPASGSLTVSVAGDTITYSFAAFSCKGPDYGKGKGRRATFEEVRSFGGVKPQEKADVAGIWNGTYTSTFSPQPTHEKIVLVNFGGVQVKGIYVSDSLASGILSGNAPKSPFELSDNDPSPPCPGRAVFQGNVTGDSMEYGFFATDCQGNIDIGKGKGMRP